MISLIFKNFFIGYNLKEVIKKILHRKHHLSGPSEVEAVLRTYAYHSTLKICINEISSATSVIFCEGLNEYELGAILKLKKRKAPHAKIVIHHGFSHPLELKDPGILTYVDLILVPSDWVKDLFIHEMEDLRFKTQSLPFPCAETEPFVHDVFDTQTILVYDKSAGFRPVANYDDMISDIRGFAETMDMKVELISYGHYDQSEYIKKLRECKFMIYLSQQETQGLALMQAWAQNVPTLIYDRGLGEWDDVVCKASSAPYFHPDVGIKFRNLKELESALHKMFKASFKPKAYYDDNFIKEVLFEKLDLLLKQL